MLGVKAFGRAAMACGRPPGCRGDLFPWAEGFGPGLRLRMEPALRCLTALCAE